MKRMLAVVAVLLLISVSWWFMPPRQSVGPAAPESMRCKNNLKLIGMALREYRDHHGTFPPPFIADSEGTPTHSWRILILPYMDQRSLYSRYRFDERWDGPHNSRLAQEMPVAYQCPTYLKTDPPNLHTSYLAVVAADSPRMGTSTFGSSTTTPLPFPATLVSESVARTVHWMSPIDMTLDDLFAGLEADRCAHKKGVNVLLADGSVPMLPKHATNGETLGLQRRVGGGTTDPTKPSRARGD